MITALFIGCTGQEVEEDLSDLSDQELIVLADTLDDENSAIAGNAVSYRRSSRSIMKEMARRLGRYSISDDPSYRPKEDGTIAISDDPSYAPKEDGTTSITSEPEY